MNPHCELELRALYERWRTLTLAEAAALTATDWTALEAAQREKAALRASIERLDHGPVPAGSRLRPLITELIAMEQENQRTLAAHRRTADKQRAALEGATRNLKQVRRAYHTRATPASVWNSYS